MVAVLEVEKRDYSRINLFNESIVDTFEEEYKNPSPGIVNNNLTTRKLLTDATLNNLISLGILLPSETEYYQVVLDNYDYRTLCRVFLESEELKTQS